MNALDRRIDLLCILSTATKRNRFSVEELRDILAERGFHVHHRTVLRDLDALSTRYPLMQCMEGRAGYWWSEGRLFPVAA